MPEIKAKNRQNMVMSAFFAVIAVVALAATATKIVLIICSASPTKRAVNTLVKDIYQYLDQH